MPDGILIIDKPAGWTSMDVCLPTRSLTAQRPRGDPSDFLSSAEMNSACGKVPPCGETLERRKRAECLAQRRRNLCPTAFLSSTSPPAGRAWTCASPRGR